LRRPPASANIAPVVHDLIIVGAVLAGISTAVEAREAGIGRDASSSWKKDLHTPM